jgi:hypothetical protein
VGDHDGFITETNKLFEVMFERLQDETEKLYPLSRQLD